MHNNELYHHGIKGMKWGVRRYQNKDGSYTLAGEKRRLKSADKAARKDRETAAKSRRILSDEEIRRRIDRIKNETELNRLTQEDLYPGRTAVTKVLKGAANKLATGAVAGAAAYAVKVALTKKFDVNEFAGYVAANPNKKK